MGFNDINLQVSGPQQPASIYKTKVLKGQVPFAVQVTEPNTKYVIKHNFVLDGDVTIPENCVLEFDGGSISGNHTITTNNTIIVRNSDDIIKAGTKIDGSIITNDYIPVEWYGAKGDGVTDDIAAFTNALLSVGNIKLKDNTTYGIGTLKNILTLNNRKLYSDNGTTIKYLNTPSGSNSDWFIRVINSKNFAIENITFDLNQIWVARPLIASGTDWDNYLATRNTSILNFNIKDSYNFKVINCNFIGGLQSLDIEQSYNFNVQNCVFCKTIADSLYIYNNSYRGIVENCHAYDNGDDAYCVNVSDASFNNPHDITFINCTGTDLRGALVCVAGGYNVTAINCRGNCLRTFGLRASAELTPPFIRDLGNVVFLGCTVDIPYNAMLATDHTTGKYYNIVYDGCTFTSTPVDRPENDQDGMIRITYMKGLQFKNCHFKDISLYFLNDCCVSLYGCIFESPNNCYINRAGDIQISNCTFINKGTFADRQGEVGKKTISSHRCCINIANSKGRNIFTGNIYKYIGSDTETMPFYGISFDAIFGTNATTSTLVDTTKIIQRNNEALKISYNGVLDRNIASIYNVACLNDGQQYIDTSGKLYMRINGEQKLIVDFNA